GFSFAWAGFVPGIHVFRPRVNQDVDGRERRQVYVVCVRQTTVPSHDVDLGYLAGPKSHASIRLNTSVALVPPKPKEFESTVPKLALSMRLRTIGMSAKTGSSSGLLALSHMKPLFIINS